jgi:hypothetical protein
VGNSDCDSAIPVTRLPQTVRKRRKTFHALQRQPVPEFGNAQASIELAWIIHAYRASSRLIPMWSSGRCTEHFSAGGQKEIKERVRLRSREHRSF